MNRILLTGAAGIVGWAIRPLLGEIFSEVLLTDVISIPEEECLPHEEFRCADISDPEQIRPLVDGVQGIVHLAGRVGPDFTFEEVLGPNIVGTNNIFQAAVESGVTHVVYAGSHHAVGYFERGAPLDETTAPRPDSFYGLSKAFGESAASYYADRHGLNVLAVRIGFVGENVIDERRLHTWISPRDLVQLIEIGLTTPDLGCELVYGVSDNPGPFFDNRNAERLGYRPRDRAPDFLVRESIASEAPDPGTPEGRYIGGHFAKKPS